MIIVDAQELRTHQTLLLLEPEEVLELIENLAFLLRNPSYHHFHFRDDNIQPGDNSSQLDVALIQSENIKTFPKELVTIIEGYFASKLDRSGSTE